MSKGKPLSFKVNSREMAKSTVGKMDERMAEEAALRESTLQARPLPVDDIKPSPNNTRKLRFSILELKGWLGIGTDDCLVDVSGEYLQAPEELKAIPGAPRPETDPEYIKKNEQYQELILLAKSIHIDGPQKINPIRIRSDNNTNIIQSGHRRHMAHIIAQQKYILTIKDKEQAESLDRDLGDLRHRYNENRQHEKLDPYENVLAYRSAVQLLSKKLQHTPKAADIKDYLSITSQEVSYLKGISDGDSLVLKVFQLGGSKSLRWGYDTNKLPDTERKQEILKVLTAKGLTLDDDDGDVAVSSLAQKQSAPRKASYVKLGKSRNKRFMKSIIGNLFRRPEFQDYKEEIIGNIDWEDASQIGEAWSKIVVIADDMEE